MADQTLTKPVSIDAAAYLANVVDSLHQHTVRVTYMFVAIIVLVLSLGSVGGYLALKAYESQLARAETREAQYQASLATFQSTLAENTAARVAAEAQVSQLQAQIAKRATQPLPAPVQTGLKPDATAQEAAFALQSVYSAVPAFGQPVATPDGKVLVTVTQTQLLIGSKVELDRTKADLQDVKAITSIQTGTISSLNNDLSQCKALQAQSEKVIAGYKAIATKSRFRKFLDGAEKVGLLMAGGIIGHVI